MISNLTIISCAFSLFLAMGLPLIALFLMGVKNRGKGIWSAWIFGALGFVVTQILIRVPILTALQSQPWFMVFAQNHMFLYAFALAFTAGLFELAGRFAVAKLMRKNLTCKRSLAAGMGHGGIEAIILVGMAYINNLVYISMINNGTFDAMVAEVVAAGVDASQLHMLKDTLLTTSPVLFLLGGFERLLTMFCHAGMTMIVCWGIHTGKAGKCALICLGIHTLIDLTAGISLLAGTVMSQTMAYIIIYTILTAAAGLSLWILLTIRRRWNAETEAVL